jgi:hypothetical protein
LGNESIGSPTFSLLTNVLLVRKERCKNKVRRFYADAVCPRNERRQREIVYANRRDTHGVVVIKMMVLEYSKKIQEYFQVEFPLIGMTSRTPKKVTSVLVVLSLAFLRYDITEAHFTCRCVTKIVPSNRERLKTRRRL